MSIAGTVYFVSSHPNTEQHFSDFCNVLTKRTVSCVLIKTDEKEKTISKVFFDKVGKGPGVVITDVGSDKMVDFYLLLKERRPDIVRIAYYDNPEPFVEGGYSANVAKIVPQADAIFFANYNFAKDPVFSSFNMDLKTDATRFGIGYYPMAKIEALSLKRESKEIRAKLREQFIQNHSIANGSFLPFYFGGANETYYKEAFPLFLKFLNELAEREEKKVPWTVVIQKHPRSGTFEEDVIVKWKKTAHRFIPNITISKVPFDDALVIADLIWYFQTSASGMFPQMEIPAIQVGNSAYKELLVKAGVIPKAENCQAFIKETHNAQNSLVVKEAYLKKSKVNELYGIEPDWKTGGWVQNLFDAIIKLMPKEESKP